MTDALWPVVYPVPMALAPLATVPVGRLPRRQQPTDHPPKGGNHHA